MQPRKFLEPGSLYWRKGVLLIEFLALAYVKRNDPRLVFTILWVEPTTAFQSSCDTGPY